MRPLVLMGLLLAGCASKAPAPIAVVTPPRVFPDRLVLTLAVEDTDVFCVENFAIQTLTCLTVKEVRRFVRETRFAHMETP